MKKNRFFQINFPLIWVIRINDWYRLFWKENAGTWQRILDKCRIIYALPDSFSYAFPKKTVSLFPRRIFILRTCHLDVRFPEYYQNMDCLKRTYILYYQPLFLAFYWSLPMSLAEQFGTAAFRLVKKLNQHMMHILQLHISNQNSCLFLSTLHIVPWK